MVGLIPKPPELAYHQTGKADIRQLTVFYDMVCDMATEDHPELETIYTYASWANPI